jgi:3-deoxy-7-phosphoheptulonate synthase/chorismate mutase
VATPKPDFATDPVVIELRDRISSADREIVAALNRRIELVATLKRHKDEMGYPFLDPDRESRMLDELAASNTGPLTDDGLGELLQELLQLTKRELGRQGLA